MKGWALDGTQATPDACASAQGAIVEFCSAKQIKLLRGEANPHKDGFLFVSVEFMGFAASAEHCWQQEQEIWDSFRQFLANRGYKPRLLF